MPEIYIFGGCNGSGKTTFATTFLSALPGVEFVNADIIFDSILNYHFDIEYHRDRDI